MSELPRPARNVGFPKAYFESPEHVDVFDPALKHYRRAFIQIPEYSARDAALEACTQGIAAAPVREDVVVRGSLTLARWFGPRARSPHDVDLVVRDVAIGPASDRAQALLGELRDAVCAGLTRARLQILENEISVDDIWTYERAEGRRLSIPYARTKGTADAIQVDIVFRAPLHDEPVFERPEPGDLRRGVWTASKSESLAWKLLWLSTDFHPQAKDLYDAVLLAEATPLSRQLLERVFEGEKSQWPEQVDQIRIATDTWAEFVAQIPSVPKVTEDMLREQLRTHLRLTD
jgi:hypothetical protein